MSKSKQKLQKKLISRYKELLPSLFDQLSSLNGIDVWGQSNLRDASTIVEQIGSAVHSIGLASMQGTHSNLDIIDMLQKYDYELCIAAKSLDNSHFINQINNLRHLYSSLIIDIPAIFDYDTSINFFNNSAKNNSFILLESIRIASDTMKTNTIHSLILNFIMSEGGDVNDIGVLMDFYKLNPKKITSEETFSNNGYKEVSDGTIIIMNFILGEWDKSAERGKKFLTLFLRNGLDLNKEYLYQNSLSRALMSKDLKLDCVKELLDRGANPNLLMRGANEISVNDSDNRKKILTTSNEDENNLSVLSVAIGVSSLDAVQLLLSYGANPLLLSDMGDKLGLGHNSTTIPIFDSGKLDLNTVEGRKYFDNVSKLIEYELLKRNLGIYPKVVLCEHQEESNGKSAVNLDTFDLASHANTATKKGKANKKHKKQSKPVKLENSDCLEESDNAFLPDQSQQAAKSKAFESYISYKENIQNDSRLSEEEQLKNRFDVLLLQNNTDALQGLLLNNPDLYGYSLSALLNSQASYNVARDTLAYNPTLLNQFYILKKQSLESNYVNEDRTSPGSLNIRGNIYEVESRFDKKIFIKVSGDVESRLNLTNDNKLSKLKVIAKDSEGQNGIKFYSNAIKLKLGKEDNAAYATKQFVDSEGNIFIEFNEMHNHRWFRGKKDRLEIQSISNTEYNDMIYYSVLKSDELRYEDSEISVLGDSSECDDA